MVLSLFTAFQIALLPRAAPRSQLSRRVVISQAASIFVAVPLVTHADVKGVNENMPKGLKDINNFLKTQGFAPLKEISGLTPFLQYIGTAPPANIDGSKSRERPYTGTLLVRFLYPSGWLPQTPSITENGEAGTVGANNYLKGDSATFSAVSVPSGTKIGSVDKDVLRQLLISQMSNDVYEDVKVRKVKPVTQEDGTDMVIIDFSYTLLTRAGFTILRNGVAGCLVARDCVVGLVTATTALRFKELEPLLRESANSFRAYSVKTPAMLGGDII